MTREERKAKVREFWKHDIHPVTGMYSGSQSTRVTGSGSVSLLNIPKNSSNQFKNVGWY
jgi:hypothetical protein